MASRLLVPLNHNGGHNIYGSERERPRQRGVEGESERGGSVTRREEPSCAVYQSGSAPNFG